MKSILITSIVLPYPLNCGGNQAQYHMIEGIRNTFDVHFLVWLQSNQEVHLNKLKSLWPNVTFHVFRNHQMSQVINEPVRISLIRKLYKSLSRKLKRYEKSTQNDFVRKNTLLYDSLYVPLDPAFVNFFSQTIAEHKYDLIQVEFFETISLGYVIPKEQKSLFVVHEPRWIRNERELNLFKEKSIQDIYTFNAAKGFEINCLNRFSHLLTLSEVDEEKLKVELPESNIHCSPATISLPPCNISEKTDTTNDTLLFLGGGGHFPNNDGLNWFCNEVVPHIKSNFKLKVTGNWDAKSQTRLKQLFPSIEFLGFIDNLSFHLNTYISIVPLRIGGGIRIKIIEAAQSFSPFITTSCGVEGLDFQDTKECLIADTPEDFANKIDLLLNNPEFQIKLANNAKSKIDNLFSSTQNITKRVKIYQEIIGV